MRLSVVVVCTVVFLGVLGAVGYRLFQRDNPVHAAASPTIAAPSSAVVSPASQPAVAIAIPPATPGTYSGSVPQQAMAAYKAGDYATAVPLLKKWASTMNVNTDGPAMGKVLTYLADAENKLNPAKADGSDKPVFFGAADPNGIIDPTTQKVRLMHLPMKSGEVRQMTIKQLGDFDFDPTKDTKVPDDVQVLSGGRVRLRGFMIPLTQADTITDFALVPSLVGCCFGQPPGVQHTITCKASAGKAVQYTVDEIWVEGTLKVNVQHDDGYTYSIFEMTVDSVKLAE